MDAAAKKSLGSGLTGKPLKTGNIILSENMALIAGKIFFIVWGFLFTAFGVFHEIGWWTKRKWIKSRGVIVGFKEEMGCEDVHYCPEIQFEGPDGPTRFTSDYGSDRKPRIGKSVNILIENKSGGSAEHLTLSNRHLFTLIPIVFGLMFALTGISMQPIGKPDRTRVPAPSRGTPNSNSP